MLTVPETRYTQCGTINIAYQVFGEGPVDLVRTVGDRAAANSGERGPPEK